MIVDVKTDTISLNIPPEDYKFYYKLEVNEIPNWYAIINFLDKFLLTFEVDTDYTFTSSIVDFFILKNHIKKENIGFPPLNLTQKTLEVCQKYIENKYETENIKKGSWNDKINPNLKCSLFFDQKAATAFLLAKDRAINACSVGIGKTPTSLAMFDILYQQNKVRNGFIFCLNENKVGTWAKQIEKFTNYSFRVVGNGTPAVCKDINKFTENLLIIHYNAIGNEDVKRDLITAGCDFWITDECHTLRNLTSGQTKGYHSIFNAVMPKWVAFMTATPVNESPMNAYSLMKLIRPKLVPSKTRFENHFCNMIMIPRYKGSKQKIPMLNKKVPYKNLDQLRFLMSEYVFRKTHADVVGFPETTLNIKTFDMEDEQREMYDKIKDETYQEIAAMPQKMLHLDMLCVRLQRLRQFLSNPASLGEKIPSIKMKVLDSILEQLLEDKNAKVVIWSPFRDTIELIEKTYKTKYGALLFAGIDPDRLAYTEDVRNNNDKLFTTEGNKHQLMSASTYKCAGSNWGAARVEIFYDLPVSSLQYVQAKGRITRRDAIGTSSIIEFCVNNSVDEWVKELLNKKEKSSKEVIDPDSEIKISKEEILGVLKK